MKANLTVSVLALAATAVVSNANATQNNSHGADFQHYFASDAAKIDYFTNGVRSAATYATYVIAGIDHNPSSSGHTIYIDGAHTGTQTTSCTVYSHDYNGTFLAAKSVSASSVSGSWTLVVSLTATEAPTWAYLSVLCNIPASWNGIVHGVSILP